MRRKPPGRRNSHNIRFTYYGFKYFLTIGFYEDGLTPCEVFISTTKQGTSLSHIAGDVCVLLSYIMQTTGDLDEVRGMLGQQQLMVGHVHDGYDHHASIAGAIIQIVQSHIAGMREGITQNAQESARVFDDTQTRIETKQAPVSVARAQGYTGDTCTSCSGVRMRRNGSCLVCDDCGTTTGCS